MTIKRLISFGTSAHLVTEIGRQKIAEIRELRIYPARASARFNEFVLVGNGIVQRVILHGVSASVGDKVVKCSLLGGDRPGRVVERLLFLVELHHVSERLSAFLWRGGHRRRCRCP